MKNFFMTAASFVIFTLAGNAYSMPDSPFYAGVLLGDTTANIRAHDIYLSNTSQQPDISTDFRRPKSESMSMMLKAGISLFDTLAFEFQSSNALLKDKVFSNINVASGPSSILEFSSATNGFYAVYQAGDEMFLNILFGAAQSTMTFSSPEYGQAEFTDTRFSYGFAVGQKLGWGFIEFNYMVYPTVDVTGVDLAKVFGTDPVDDRVELADSITQGFLGVGYVFKF